jgi:hypothetical protein
MKRLHNIFHARVEPVQIQQKARYDMLHRTCVFASGWICGSHSSFGCVRGVKYRHAIFHAHVGLLRIQQKACQNTFRQTCVFASGGICGSRSSFRCVWGPKHRRTIFHVQLGPVRDTYAELVLLHHVGSVGHVVHCGASVSQIVDALFFMLGWDRFKLKKTCQETLRRTCVFASGGICGSRNAFRFIQGTKG